MNRIKLSIIFFILLISIVKADDFMIQKDSYFVPLRSKIFWTLGSSLGFGNGWGYRDVSMGAGSLELLRFIGRVKPEPLIFEYIWCSIVAEYGVYQNNTRIDEIIASYSAMGLGFKLNNNTYPWKFVPYIGFGLGSCAIINKRDINTSNPEEYVNGGDLMYVEVFGIEWYLSKEISLFIEQSFMWGTILIGDNYIPDWEDIYGATLEDGTFKKREIDFRYFKIYIGARFYWGQNMFWFFGFWED